MQRAQSRPESTAFIFEEHAWTYRRLAEESERVAQGLAASGVKAGDRVVLHMMNRPEMLVAYYACFRMGAIAAPLRTAFTFAELAPMLQRLQPALYIGESALYPNVAPVDATILPREKRFIVDDAEQTHAVQPWDVLKQAPHSDLPTPASHQPAVLINTSGSTGQPKFVVHTLDTVAATTELIHKHFGLSADDVIVSPLQLAHGTGFTFSLLFVRFGLPFIMLQSANPAIVLDCIERYRSTWMVGFPYQYAGLLEAQQAKPRDVSSLRICLTGGDVCPVACHPAVEEAGAVGKPDPVLGQRVFGFVKLASGAREGVVAEILQNVAGRLAPYKVPEGLRVIDALPRNGLGKVDRRALERMVGEDESAESLPEEAPSRASGEQPARLVAQKR
jgi:long-chain acyl-CoA synthetase